MLVVKAWRHYYTCTVDIIALLMFIIITLTTLSNHSDWLSTALISALIEQFNRTVRVMPK